MYDFIVKRVQGTHSADAALALALPVGGAPPPPCPRWLSPSIRGSALSEGVNSFCRFLELSFSTSLSVGPDRFWEEFSQQSFPGRTRETDRHTGHSCGPQRPFKDSRWRQRRRPRPPRCERKHRRPRQWRRGPAASHRDRSRGPRRTRNPRRGCRKALARHRRPAATAR